MRPTTKAGCLVLGGFFGAVVGGLGPVSLFLLLAASNRQETIRYLGFFAALAGLFGALSGLINGLIGTLNGLLVGRHRGG